VASYDNTSNNLNNGIYSGGFFNRTLRRLSSFGQNWQDQVIRNTQLIGYSENPSDPSNVGTVMEGPGMYDLFTKRIISKILDKKSIAYLDRSYFDKRKILQQYSMKEEIRDFLNQMADEAIIYNSDNFFAYINDLPDDFSKQIRDKYHENFKNLYQLFGFSDGAVAWNNFRDLLIDGYLAFELVYDNKQKNIISLNKIDPITLVIATEPTTGTIVWVQNPDNPQLRRIILDTNIIYISYSNNKDYSETSYVESLIRPYNQLKLLEQTKLLYNINQAAIYKKFIIPTDGLTRAQAEQQIFQLMSEYHEDVQWDDNMGTVKINGSANIPHSKDFWFPSSEGNAPSVEITTPQGIDLNEDTVLNWFSNNLKRSSRLPLSRFDSETGGGSAYSADSSDITREEIKFKNYINRLRTIYKEILIKPLKIQMILDFPELENDNLFNSSLKLNFNKDELFEEWKRLNNLAKRAEIVSTLTSNFTDLEGNSYFHPEWLARNVMMLTEKDIQENNKYKYMPIIAGSAAPAGEGGGGTSGGGGGDFGAETGGGDFGSEPSGGTENAGGAQAQTGGSETGGAAQSGAAQGEAAGGTQAQF
jgi:hypothetical protein